MKEPSNGGTSSMLRAGENLWRNQSSGIYYALFKRGGKQIRRSLKTTDRTLAKRRLEDLRGKVEGLKVGVKDLSFGDLAAKWLITLKGGNLKPNTYLRRVVAVKSLTPYFGTLSARNITPQHGDQWKAQRGPLVGASTYNIERETLQGIFRYAQREGLIIDSPVRFLPRRKMERTSIVIPSREQFRKLVAQLQAGGVRTQPAASFAQFLAYSGCRLGEAIAVCWGEVNFEQKTFTVTGGEGGTKNHEARHVPLFPPLERLLLSLREGRAMPPQPSDRIFDMETTKKALGTACQKAGLPHFTHHSLRHFFCSNAIEAGIDFKVIAGWLGHKDGGVLVAKTYGHLRDEHSAAMAQRMTFDVGGQKGDET